MTKLTEKQKALLKKTTDEFLEAIRERVAICLLLEDVEALNRLVTQLLVLTEFEVLHTLWQKGFGKEIENLCKKAGKMNEQTHNP